MIKRILLISLLMCGVIFAEVRGKVERFSKPCPVVGSQSDKNIFTYFITGNFLWTRRTANIPKFELIPCVSVRKATQKVSGMYFIIRLGNKIMLENVDKIHITLENKNGKTTSFILSVESRGCFGFTRKQLRQMTSSSMITIGFRSNNKIYAGVGALDNIAIIEGFRTKIVNNF